MRLFLLHFLKAFAVCLAMVIVIVTGFASIALVGYSCKEIGPIWTLVAITVLGCISYAFLAVKHEGYEL